MRDIYTETVAAGAARKAACLTNKLVYTVSYFFQYQITVIPSVKLIYDVKTVYIENYGVHRHIIVLIIKASAVFNEEFLIKKTGQTVTLRFVNDNAVLGEFN